MNKKMLDLQSDYLLASGGGLVTATGLSKLLDGEVSRDSVTRFLRNGGQELTAKEWWMTVNPLVRRLESEEGTLIIDDTIAEKPCSEENPIICWHFDHSKGRNLKSINLLTLLYTARVGPEEDALLSVPHSFELIEKTNWEARTDANGSEQHRRVSAKSKNERFRSMLLQAPTNQFTNKYRTESVLYLVTSNTTSGFEQITGIYHKRWKVEECHKSIKQNAEAAKSPAQTEATQARHLLCCLYAFTKIERLKLANGLNHFALKTKLYYEGLSRALKALHSLRPTLLHKLAPPLQLQLDRFKGI